MTAKRDDLVFERDDIQARLVDLQGEVQRQKERYAQLWRMSCEQLEGFDKTLEDKDEQIRSRLEKIQQLEAETHAPAVAASPMSASRPAVKPLGGRRGSPPHGSLFQ